MCHLLPVEKKQSKNKQTKTTIVKNFQKRYYVKTWGPLNEIYLKFRSCYHTKRHKDGTEISRDGILNQHKLTGCVICYRENSQNIVIQFLMLYYMTRWRPRKEIYVKFGACHHKKRLRNGTETSRDAILNQSSLTGIVICYRENSDKTVIHFQT